MKQQTMSRDQQAAHYASLRARVVSTWKDYRSAKVNRPDSAEAAYTRHVDAQNAFASQHGRA